MNSTTPTLGRMLTAVAAALAASAAAAAPVSISIRLSTDASFDDPRDAKPIVVDNKGPATSGALESYVESVVARSGRRDAMASALADDKGNAQVGAEVGYENDTGFSTASSSTKIGYTNNTTNRQEITFSFEVLPGEVLITNTGSIGLPPRPGEFSGGISYQVNRLDRNNEGILVHDCQLSIINTVKEWEFGASTNDCGLDQVDELFDGNGQYGVKLKGATVLAYDFLDPGDTVFARLDMFAWVNRTAIDWSGQISAKLGDPSNPALRSAFSVDVVDATTPPNPVPEPGSAWLASLALLGLGAAQAKRGASLRAA